MKNQSNRFKQKQQFSMHVHMLHLLNLFNGQIIECLKQFTDDYENEEHWSLMNTKMLAKFNTVNTDEHVLNSVRRDPTISTRRLSIQLGISKNKVWRVLRRNHLHPFHYTPVQELLPVDLPNRANFCRLLLNNEEHNPSYLSSILWTDESTFTRDGITNFHNLHEWQPENPHVKRESSFQRRFSVNVWCGIIGNNFIGPILLPERLNSQNYLEFLNETAPTVLDSIPLMMRNTFLYQQDGAPAHYGRQVLNWFDINYPGRWIGRSGPIAWPARSPDLTPLDFSVWGYLKGEVYKTNIQTREQLVDRINNAGNKIKENLENFNMCAAIKRRLQLCLLQNGNHFENCL